MGGRLPWAQTVHFPVKDRVEGGEVKDNGGEIALGPNGALSM